MTSTGYEDMRVIKSLLEKNDEQSERDRTQELVLLGATLESLRDIKDRLDKIERKIATKGTDKTKVKKEIKKEISLIEQLKGLSEKDKESLLNIVKPKQTEKKEESVSKPKEIKKSPIKFESVADKKRNKIKELILQYGKLTSSQLSKLIGLSRTRCNEYLKELESEGELTAFTDNKKRYYQLNY